MDRQAIPKLVPVPLKMDPELRDRLQRQAAEHDRSLGAEIRHACRLYLRSLERKQP